MRERYRKLLAKTCKGDPTKMISILLSILLYRLPKIKIGNDEGEQYEKLLESICDDQGGVIEYTLPFPKYRFLYYVSLKEKYVFHGSNNQNIKNFEPREQTLYNGKVSKAVFATTDPIWPLFYAVFKRSSLIGSFRNGCLLHKDYRYHYYSLNESTMQNSPWTQGMLYFLPMKTFSKSGMGRFQFDEWISHEPVSPIGRLVITSDDFLSHNKVSTHKNGESLLKTWMLYKIRTLWAKSEMASNIR